MDLGQIARITAGFTGADLENLLNEAAILAAKNEKAFITQAEINEAMIKVGIGKEREVRLYPRRRSALQLIMNPGMQFYPCSAGCGTGSYRICHSDRSRSGRLYHAIASEG